MVMKWSTSTSTSASRVWGLIRQGRIAWWPPTTVEDGIERVVRRSRRRISAFTALLAREAGAAVRLALSILARLTLPSTTPEFQGGVSPLTTASWSCLPPNPPPGP